MKTTLSPYLMFDGNARSHDVQSVLGGELTMQTFGEAMPEGTPPESRDRIIHAALQNDLLSFMASDSPPGSKVTSGDNVQLCIVGSDQESLTRYFGQLADGGSVDMPLDRQFWGDVFGTLTDRFGAHWMVNISSTQE